MKTLPAMVATLQMSDLNRRAISGGVIGLITLLLIACQGCAFPHRISKASKEVREYDGRPDGLKRVTIIQDREGGGGVFFMTTSDVQMMNVSKTNITELGGGSYLTIGPYHQSIDPQTGQIVQDLGSAVGNVIGAAARKSAGIP